LPRRKPVAARCSPAIVASASEILLIKTLPLRAVEGLVRNDEPLLRPRQSQGHMLVDGYFGDETHSYFRRRSPTETSETAIVSMHALVGSAFMTG